MLELFGIFNYIENYSGYSNIKNDNIPNPIPTSWIIIALIIGYGAAYIAYECNKTETPASRALATILAFFFSGFYLLYYFIIHVLFGKKCGKGNNYSRSYLVFVKKS
jgi:hypothetical protein